MRKKYIVEKKKLIKLDQFPKAVLAKLNGAESTLRAEKRAEATAESTAGTDSQPAKRLRLRAKNPAATGAAV